MSERLLTMKLSKRPIDWILLALALAFTLVALNSFADFSGKSAPQWRQPAIFTGLALCLLVTWLSIRSGRYR
jgi:hypothetical protein